MIIHNFIKLQQKKAGIVQELLRTFDLIKFIIFKDVGIKRFGYLEI